MFFSNTRIFEDATYKSRKYIKCVELPLTQHELYKHIVIDPPRNVLFYGLLNTGKTMHVKAVANHTIATLIRVFSLEFVQKYLEMYA
ncbi:hypothetical protein T459_24987 [Capsicum annuum]|uniref:ATPase AAA-type core domain-containing protein n=1 Tax=Capsicum annuum TaxID=4072 RepID=A0A2G2YJG6_CAPAN|nr:hypothetical protein T459_24987 [Capsicum annuum]